MTAPRATTRPLPYRRRTPRTETARRAATWRPQRTPLAADTIDWPVRGVQAALFLGLVAILSLPHARVASAGLGMVPLWLVLLPASAWLSLALARRVAARA